MTKTQKKKLLVGTGGSIQSKAVKAYTHQLISSADLDKIVAITQRAFKKLR